MDSRSETHTDTYDAINAPGKSALKGVTPEAVKARIKADAAGVRVIEVSNEAMKLIIITGDTSDEVAAGMIGPSAETMAFPNEAPFDNNGKITPPGNLAAEANAIAENLAKPT